MFVFWAASRFRAFAYEFCALPTFRGKGTVNEERASFLGRQTAWACAIPSNTNGRCSRVDGGNSDPKHFPAVTSRTSHVQDAAAIRASLLVALQRGVDGDRRKYRERIDAIDVRLIGDGHRALRVNSLSRIAGVSADRTRKAADSLIQRQRFLAGV